MMQDGSLFYNPPAMTYSEHAPAPRLARFRCIETHGSSELQALSIVAGQLSGPLVLRPTGHVSVLGVRLRPYGAAALLRARQTDFIGHTLDVELASAALARTLRPAARSPLTA